MLYTNNAWKLYNFNRCHLRSIKYVLKMVRTLRLLISILCGRHFLRKSDSQTLAAAIWEELK